MGRKMALSQYLQNLRLVKKNLIEEMCKLQDGLKFLEKVEEVKISGSDLLAVIESIERDRTKFEQELSRTMSYGGPFVGNDHIVLPQKIDMLNKIIKQLDNLLLQSSKSAKSN